MGNWDREVQNRDDIAEIIRNDINEKKLPSCENVFIVNTDADEIPNVEVLKELRPEKSLHAKVLDQPMQLNMNLSYFNFNWNNGPCWKKGSVVSA